MKIREITNVLEEFAPLNYQESYDNAGLITGNPEDMVNSALFCVDVTEKIVDECINKGFNLIISHHPVIFYPLKKINGITNTEKIIIKAIKNNIAIYACHTNLDFTRNGVSIRMAEMIGLKNIRVLIPQDETGRHGIGAIGELIFPEESITFLNHIKNIFNTVTVRHSEICTDKIYKAAVSSGSGGTFMEDAVAAGADIYITADLRYNNFLDAAGRIILADIGHFESEFCTIDILYEIVTKNFPKFATCKSENSINPVIYLS